jgi:hypothetical protein
VTYNYVCLAEWFQPSLLMQEGPPLTAAADTLTRPSILQGRSNKEQLVRAEGDCSSDRAQFIPHVMKHGGGRYHCAIPNPRQGPTL